MNTTELNDTDATAADPFDPANLRLSQDFTQLAGAKKLLTTVPVRKPQRQDYVRVHPAPEYQTNAALIELKEEGEIYLVAPQLREALAGEWFPAMIYTATNRQGVVFLWPTKLPGPDGKLMDWHRTSREAAEYAMGRWVRVQANKSLGAYETTEGSKSIPDPVWPDLPLKELLRIGFRDRLIDRIDHPVIKHLQGL